MRATPPLMDSTMYFCSGLERCSNLMPVEFVMSTNCGRAPSFCATGVFGVERLTVRVGKRDSPGEKPNCWRFTGAGNMSWRPNSRMATATQLIFIARKRVSSKLLPWISFSLFLPGWLQTHRLVNVLELFLHLFVFLVFRELPLRIRSAPRLPVDRAQTKVGHGAGGIKLDGVLEKRLCFLRLTHCHQDFRQTDIGRPIIRTQPDGLGVSIVRLLQVASTSRNIAKPAFGLFIKRINLDGFLVFAPGFFPGIWSR